MGYLDDGQQYKHCNGSFCVRRAIQNCFLLNLSDYVKSYGHLCQVWLAFFHDHSPNMDKSCDS